MALYRISGGRPLVGSVRISGAKNAASKLVVASLLTDEPCELSNVPAIGEVAIALELVRSAGAHAQQLADHVHVSAASLSGAAISHLSRKNRLPILAIGPLLHRTGHAHVPRLGGDKIGPRPVDFHLQALRAFGATVEETSDAFIARADRLRGAEITLPYPSVGSTETVLLTATLADGITRLANAAVEPEIKDLIRFLQKMGARIRFTGDRSLEIEGVERLHGAVHRVIPDRLEAASYASIALATAGDIVLTGTSQEDLMPYLSFVEDVGGSLDIRDESIRVWRSGPLTAATVKTDVFPGFATDWQQPSAVVLTQASGDSIVHETVYEDRFGYTDDLVRMGASISVDTDCGDAACRFTGKNIRHVARITGPASLKATSLTIPDIRAGMAHVIAALTAPGESIVDRVEILDRGYEQLETKLQRLGAAVLREDGLSDRPAQETGTA